MQWLLFGQHKQVMFKTFDDFGKTYFQNLLLEFEKATTVVNIFDRYNVANSVKVGERT